MRIACVDFPGLRDGRAPGRELSFVEKAAGVLKDNMLGTATAEEQQRRLLYSPNTYVYSKQTVYELQAVLSLVAQSQSAQRRRERRVQGRVRFRELVLHKVAYSVC